MPRPERIRAREKAAAGDVTGEPPEAEEPPAKPLNRKDEAGLRRTLRVGAVQVVEPEENETVDNPQQVEHPGRTGQVAEGDAELELSRRVASKMGWVPRDEWKRSPETWTDAPEYLENTPRQIEAQRERLRRMGQVAEDQAEQARRDALAEARREHDTALQAGDTEAATKAVDKIAKTAAGPPPQTAAWMARNPWFRTGPNALDDEATALTVAAIRKAGRMGATVEEQLQAGEVAARKRFPENFDDIQPLRREEMAPRQEQPREPQREARLSEVRPPPPVMAEGSRSGGGRQAIKEKGWMDIPSADRSQMQQFVRRGMRKGQTERQATDFLAASYWNVKRQKGEIA